MSLSYSSSNSSDHTKRCRRSKDSVSGVSVADVYDMAAHIGKEFELLIDSHGPEHVTHLMQKVIAALEHLEQLAADKEKENTLIDSLRTTITRLELDDHKRLQERQRHDRELEQMEEHYKEETKDLLCTVKRLQDENRKLSCSLAAANERDSAFSEDESYLEVALVNKLEAVIEKQRSRIKDLDIAILDGTTQVEELKCANEQLSSCTRDLRRKLRLSQSHINVLVDERAELTARVHDLQADLHQLAQQLGTATQDCQELRLVEQQPPSDANDPNRPRFSLAELRDILQERNILKAKVSDLEDELALFRPRPAEFSSVTASPRLQLSAITAQEVADQCHCSYHSGKHSIEEEDDDHDAQLHDEEAADSDNSSDLPVQGPLPEDPIDAPWRRHESGIRKLFRRFFHVSSDEDCEDKVQLTGKGLRKSLSRLSFL